MNVEVYTDGASRGNPGNAAIAYFIKGLKAENIEFGQVIGTASNNVAEYRGLIEALKFLTFEGVKNATINFFADSELIVKQMNGEYRVKNAQMIPLYEEATRLFNALGKSNGVSITAIAREKNSQADRLCNLALDGKL